MSQKSGLASAVEASKGGVTTLASRFEAGVSDESDAKPSSRISDLASKFSQQTSISNPSTSTPPPKPLSKPLSKPSPKKATPKPPSEPQNLSKKVSDLTRAFSNTGPSGASSNFTQAQSAFSKADSESRVSAVARKLDSSDGPSDKVSGVARTFESMDTGKAAFVPKLEKKDVEKKVEERVEEKIDQFHVVAGRFERGQAGEKIEQEEHDGKARERFLDAAKRFGG